MGMLQEKDGKTSWLRSMSTAWVFLCGALSAVAQWRNTDLLSGVLSMLQMGFGSLVLAYIGSKGFVSWSERSKNGK